MICVNQWTCVPEDLVGPYQPLGYPVQKRIPQLMELMRQLHEQRQVAINVIDSKLYSYREMLTYQLRMSRPFPFGSKEGCRL